MLRRVQIYYKYFTCLNILSSSNFPTIYLIYSILIYNEYWNIICTGNLLSILGISKGIQFLLWMMSKFYLHFCFIFSNRGTHKDNTSNSESTPDSYCINSRNYFDVSRILDKVDNALTGVLLQHSNRYF